MGARDARRPARPHDDAPSALAPPCQAHSTLHTVCTPQPPSALARAPTRSQSHQKPHWYHPEQAPSRAESETAPQHACHSSLGTQPHTHSPTPAHTHTSSLGAHPSHSADTTAHPHRAPPSSVPHRASRADRAHRLQSLAKMDPPLVVSTQRSPYQPRPGALGASS